MTREALALARHRLERATATLEDAHLLFGSGAWDGAVNRYYYAAFHAARALLATRGLDSAKHSGVIALFNQHFIKTGLLSPDMGRALVRSFEKRLTSDYSDFTRATDADAEEVKRDVTAFIAACRRLLDGQSLDPT